MPQSPGSPELDLEVAALKERYAGLRQAAALPGADARAGSADFSSAFFANRGR